MDQTANVTLQANANQYNSQMTGAARTTNALVLSVNALNNAINNVTKSAGRRLEIIGTGQIASLAAATISAAKFQQQMAVLNANAALTGKSFASMQSQVDATRRNFAISTEAAAGLAQQLIQLGQSSTQVEKLSTTFIKLSAVTGEPISQLVDGLTNLQRLMGTQGTQYTERFASSLATVAAKAGVSATSVLSFANSIAPIGRAAGLTQNQITGLSAAFVKSGADGYAAGNAFNTMLTGITRAIQYGSPDLKAYANLLGVSVDQFKQMGAYTDVTKLFDVISKQGPDALKTLDRFGLDGVRTLKAIQAVAGQPGGINSAVSDAISGYNNTKPFDQAASRALTGFNDEVTKLRNNLTSIAQEIGATFLPAATKIVQVLNGMAHAAQMVLDPIAKIVGALGLAGGVGAVALGAMATGFTRLVGIGSVVGVIRKPVAGAMNARSVLAGRGLTASGQAVEEGAVGPIGRGMFRMGESAYLGGAVLRERFGGGGGGGGSTGGPGLLSRTAGRGIQGIGAFARWGLEPLYPSQLNNIGTHTQVFGPGGQFGKTADAFKGLFRGKDGEDLETTVTKQKGAFGALISETGKLGWAMSKASAGVGLGVGRAGVAVGRSVGGRLLGAAGGLIAANPELAVLGAGIAGYSIYQHHQATIKDELNDTNNFAPGQAYAVALGDAARATTSFADVVRQNTNKLGGGAGATSVAQALSVNQQDLTTAGSPNKKLTDPTFSRLNARQAGSYASLALQGATPDQATLLKYDILHQYGPQQGQQILSQLGRTSGQQGFDLTGLTQGLGSPTSVKTLGDALKNVVARQVSPTNQARAGLVGLNQIITAGQGNNPRAPYKSGEDIAIARALGATDDASVNAIRNALYQTTAGGGTQGFQQSLAGSKSAAGRALQYFVGNVGPGFNRFGTNFSPGAPGADGTFGPETAYTVQQLRSVGAGRALTGTTGANLLSAIATPSNANLQVQASQNLLATTLGANHGSMSETISALQQFKGAINDATDPLQQLAQAAQDQARQVQSEQMHYLTPASQAGTLVQNYRNALVNEQQNPSADASASAEQARQAVEGAKQSAFDMFRQIEISWQNFSIARSRGEQDYTRALGREVRDYSIARRQAESDFQLSRRRQEQDFQHSLVLMAEQTSESVYNVYQRITVTQSLSASNLLQNLQDQQKALTGQLNNLQTLRGEGVSGNVIKLLGLDQSTNAQQLARFVQEISNDPAMVKAYNDLAAKRLKASTKLSQDADNTQFQEMEHQFKLGLSRSQTDFDTSMKRQASSFQRSLNDQALDYSISMSRMISDFQLQLKQTTEFYATSASQVDNVFTNLATTAISHLTGTAKAQASALYSQLQGISTKVVSIVGSTSATIGKLGAGGGLSQGNAPSPTGTNQKIVAGVAAQYGWATGAEWTALYDIIMHESGFRNTAQNPSSTAYGIFQFLDSTWKTVGASKTSDPTKQAIAGMKYIQSRYGDPIAAERHEKASGWYAAGSIFDGPQMIGVGEKGPEAVLPLNDRGVDFMMNVFTKFNAMNKRGPGGIPTQASTTNYYSKVDQSTHYTGDIKVMANDPRAFERQLAARKRMKKLVGA